MQILLFLHIPTNCSFYTLIFLLKASLYFHYHYFAAVLPADTVTHLIDILFHLKFIPNSKSDSLITLYCISL